MARGSGSFMTFVSVVVIIGVIILVADRQCSVDDPPVPSYSVPATSYKPELSVPKTPLGYLVIPVKPATLTVFASSQFRL